MHSATDTKRPVRICYVNITSHLPARDVVYVGGFKECGAEIIDIRDSAPGIRKFLNIYHRHRKLKGEYDFVLVGYAAQILVPFVRFISRKPIIFNALGTLSEGIFARRRRTMFSLKGVQLWMLDYLAFHLATLSLIDNNVLIDAIAKKFFVSRKKLVRAWTGVDENSFFYDAAIPKLPDFTVLFRGELANDSGIQYLITAAKKLAHTHIKFRILGRGPMAIELERMLKSFPSANVEWIPERLDIRDLRKKMQETHLSIGWLSGGMRAPVSIPHKTFETLALKLPFLQARLPAMQELFVEDVSALFCKPDDPDELARILKDLEADPAKLHAIAENGYQLFDRNLRSKRLAQDVLTYLAVHKIIRF